MNTKNHEDEFRLTTDERDHLRRLAERVAKIGNDPVQAKKADMWRSHNDLNRVKPMVLVFPEGSWRELLPPSELTISAAFWRNVELDLRRRIYYWDHLRDDNVIEPVIAAPIVIRGGDWGVDLKQTKPDDALGAYHIDPVIVEDDDAEKLKTPTVTVDWDETEKLETRLKEVFEPILRVERRGKFRGGMCPMDFYAKLRGIDVMFMDMIDKPALVHDIVGKIVQGEIAMIKSLEEQGGLTLGNRNHYAGSGGTSYTSELPAPDFDGVNIRVKDLWGFATDQIFSEVSPKMHEEFALSHEREYLDLFGLNCYGCCEPLHNKFDVIFKYVPRLRRISISPWADVAKSSETLQDKVVFSWKPNPADLAGDEWNPKKIETQLEAFCEATKENVVEIIMKDTHTVRNEPRRMWEWVDIARRVAESHA